MITHIPKVNIEVEVEAQSIDHKYEDQVHRGGRGHRGNDHMDGIENGKGSGNIGKKMNKNWNLAK
jgi:hypothetical protein